ncbi:hypothetical protein HPG69_000698 [Diceros bicornis minor]|uniref:Cytochrome c oxidase subunit NDUFA4 n=1 Tax=Diceros bicornis minor TaxID=77932 RepID=A0A7J7FI74_DICBM|nr:hypothetical protein HPG69_000698 [Diceros bicornis minor]
MFRQIFTQAKKHPSLIPLFIFIGAGGTGAALYVLRLAIWDRKNNPEPWNKLGPNDQYKAIGNFTGTYLTTRTGNSTKLRKLRLGLVKNLQIYSSVKAMHAQQS